MFAKHPEHAAVREVLAAVDQPPVLSPLVVAEIDYMVLDARGVLAGSTPSGCCFMTDDSDFDFGGPL